MRESVFETLIGLVVLVVAGAFLWFAIGRDAESAAPANMVELGVRFNSASGIERGTDVRMAGVKIGTVRKVELDAERAEAQVTLGVSERLIPLDDGTSARVQTESLLGGNYINLEPASGYGEIEPCGEGEELFGESGCGEILYSQGSIDLLTLFASFASGSGGGGSSQTGSGSGASPGAASSQGAAPADTETEDENEDGDASSSGSETSFGEPYPGTGDQE